MHAIQKKLNQGLTLIELLVALGIVAALAVAMMSYLTGLKASDSVDRAAQQIYDDLIYIRSRSISTNANHRIVFSANNTWRLEQLVVMTWTPISQNRQMPSNTNLTATVYTNVSTLHLEATPRGLFILNGLSGTPYVTIETLGSSKTKSINVDIGGAVEVVLD